jgi:hypothetical protein
LEQAFDKKSGGGGQLPTPAPLYLRHCIKRIKFFLRIQFIKTRPSCPGTSLDVLGPFLLIYHTWGINLILHYDMFSLFDRKIHTIDMLFLFLLEPIQKFCLKIAKIEHCQNWNLLELKIAKIESWQNWKLPKLEIAEIESCQN